MSDDQDTIIDAEFEVLPGPEAGADAAPPPAPMVVIEYRTRGLSAMLGPPALILLSALAILSYQRQRPIRPIPPPPDPARVAAPKPPPEPLIVKVITSPAPTDRAADLPFPPDVSPRPDRPDGPGASPPATADAAPAPRPDPAPAPEPTPEPEPVPRPVEVAVVARPAIGFVPPEERPPPAAEPEPERPAPTREEVMDDIRREADQKEAERQRLEEIKPRLGAMALIEDIRDAQAKRAAFHGSLREILASAGEEAGKEIHNLCESFGRTARPEIDRAVDHALRTSHARLGRRAKVEMMRFLGWPEPKILDFLAKEVHLDVNSRGGPRDRNDVRVHAARLLLKIPVATARPASASRPAPGAAAGASAGAAASPVRAPNAWPQ